MKPTHGFAANVHRWLLAALLIAASAFAQSAATGEIAGRVLNSTAGNYLANVRITVDGTALEAFTNADGEYRLAGVPAGSVNLRLSYGGLAREGGVVSVTAGQVAARDFEFAALTGEPPKAAGEVVTMQEFTVVEREMSAQAAAVQEQRAAPNLKAVVAFEEFGDLGEGNVGEFLKYLPGVQVDQNPAVGSSALIRGMPAEGTLLMVDGVELASDAPAGRGPSFTGTNTGNIDRIEVTKVPTPDMPANAVGGMINMIGKSGFSRSRPLFTYNVFGTLTTLEPARRWFSDMTKSSGPDRDTDKSHLRPGFDLSYIHPVNRQLAVSLSAGYNSRWEDKDYLAPTWNRVTNIQTTSGLNAAMALRERTSASLRVDWKPGRRHAFWVTAQYSTDDVYSRQHAFNQAYGAGATGGEFFTQGAATGVGTATQALTYRNQLKSTTYAGLGHRFEGGVWKADWNLAYSRAERQTLSDQLGFFGTVNATVTSLVLRGDGLDGIYSRTPPSLTALNRAGQPVNIYDGAGYTINSVTAPLEPLMTNDVLTFKGNVSREFTGRFPLRLATGVSFVSNERDLTMWTSTWNFRPPGGAPAQIAGLYDVINESYSQDRTFKGGTQVRWIDPGKVYDLYRAQPTWFVLNEPALHTSRVNGSKYLEEIISAGYVRGDLRLIDNRLWIVGGVRYERTDDDGQGPLNDVRATYQQDANGNLVLDAAGRPIRVSTDPLTIAKLQYTERGSQGSKSYDGFYPSVNTTYSFTSDLLLRAAYASTIGRPDLNFIIPSQSVADPTAAEQNRTINVTNTGLQPWTADNYDLSLESYSVKGATAAMSLFRKNISRFFTSVRTDATPELLAEMGLPDDYLDYDVITTQNSSEDVALSGLELSWRQSLRPLAFVPAWAKGVQLWTNVTWLRLDGEGKDNFTGYSPRNVNWGVSYTTARFLAKFNVSQTMRTRNNPDAVSATTPPETYQAVDWRMLVDASFEYRFHKRLAFYGSVRNLNAYPKFNITYSPNAPAFTRPRSYQYYGTLLTFGIKGTW